MWLLTNSRCVVANSLPLVCTVCVRVYTLCHVSTYIYNMHMCVSSMCKCTYCIYIRYIRMYSYVHTAHTYLCMCLMYVHLHN